MKNRNFGQKSKFWSKIEILVKNLNFGQKLVENRNLVQNRNFIRKSKFYSKIEILFENRNFGEKSKFGSKFEIVSKIKLPCQKSKIFISKKYVEYFQDLKLSILNILIIFQKC